MDLSTARTELTADARRDSRRQREAFRSVRNAEQYYAVQLRKVAGHITDLVRMFVPPVSSDETMSDDHSQTLQRALGRYSEALRPWAQILGQRMLMDVARRDERAWVTYTRDMGGAIREQIQNAPVGDALREFLDTQVELITSLPTDAAKRVHELVTGNIYTGARFSEVTAQLMRTGLVTRSRANLIARTETARAASGFTMVRAQAVGSGGYVWRTVRDEDVRPMHRKLEGTFHRWDDPPVSGERGERAHAGMIYNCFPGHTLVYPSDRYRRVFRAYYRGEVVAIQSNDAVLVVTPNHPIKTIRGLIPAGQLNDSDYLVQMADQRLDSVKRNVHDETAVPFSKFYETCRQQGYSSTALKHDFYGDTVDDQVEVVFVEPDLPFYLQTRAYKSVGNQVIPSTKRGIGTIGLRGGDLQIAESFVPRVANQLLSLFDSGSFHSDAVGFGDTTTYDTNSFKRFGYSAATDLILLGELLFGRPVEVFGGDGFVRQLDATNCAGTLDNHSRRLQVLAEYVGMHSDNGGGFDQQRALGYKLARVRNVSRSSFSGHVYTAETVSGYYRVGMASMAIAGNCRCYCEPVVPEHFD